MTITVKSLIVVTVTVCALWGGYMWLAPLGPKPSDHIFQQYQPDYKPQGQLREMPSLRKE